MPDALRELSVFDDLDHNLAARLALERASVVI
jgi:hypothetical protein